MMQKAALFLSILLCASVFGDVVDIQFSPGCETPGNWTYDGDVTLSFPQIIAVDLVNDATTDALYMERVYIPDLVFSEDYTVVTPDGSLEIKDSVGNLLLSGTLDSGDFWYFFTVAATHTEYKNDFVVTYINNTIGSDYLNTISVGTQFDFNLTLQGDESFGDILGDGNTHTDGFSGSMDVIPEPATICLLGLGSLLLFGRRRASRQF